MDDNYKSKYPSFEKKEVIECNNINVNNNGFNGATLPPAINGLATEAISSEGNFNNCLPEINKDNFPPDTEEIEYPKNKDRNIYRF